MSIITPVSAYKPLASHRFMKSMASGGLARFIMLEAFVEAGRTYQAYRRGGFDEGRERITEEFTAAVFWLGGVKAFNAINDKIGKWILGLKTANFDLGEDKARNPLKTFLHSEIAKFKSAKLITSILLANAMIGFVVPKLNQRITRYYHRNDNAKPQTVQQNQEQMTQQTQQQPQTQQSSLAYNPVSVNMDKFIADAKTRSKDVSFGASPLLSLAFNLENNTTWQLLSTDIGTTSGRTISARNNDERREILFRDLSSIYFYMFNMPNINNWLNRIEQKGRKTRVDSMNAAYTKDLMVNLVNQNYNGKISAKDLAKEMLGDTSKTLPEAIKAKFKDFLELFTKLSQRKNVLPLPEFIAELLEESGYLRELQEEDTDEARARIDNLQELINVAREFEPTENDNALGEFLAQVALVSDLDETPEQDNAVTLMTLHAAKGLEFKTVFLAGLEEGIFPHSRSLNNNTEMEEERRLMYVGVTRAEEKLFLCFANRRRVWGEIKFYSPSRFLSEIPDELVERRKSSTDYTSLPTFKRAVQSIKLDVNKGYVPTKKGFGMKFEAPIQNTTTKVVKKQPTNPKRDPIIIKNDKNKANDEAKVKSILEDNPIKRKLEEKKKQEAASHYKDITLFSVGDRVFHKRFGVGTIEEVKDIGSSSMYVIDFGRQGKKAVDAYYMNLKKF